MKAVLAEIQSREQNANPEFDDRFDIPDLGLVARGMGVSESQILKARIAGVQANPSLEKDLRQQILSQLGRGLEIVMHQDRLVSQYAEVT